MPVTTVPSGLSPLISRSAALVFSTSRLTTFGFSFSAALFCSAGWVAGLVGSAVGADSDEGLLGSMDAVGAWAEGWTCSAVGPSTAGAVDGWSTVAAGWEVAAAVDEVARRGGKGGGVLVALVAATGWSATTPSRVAAAPLIGGARSMLRCCESLKRWM